jgi:hypothetical protein
MVNFYASILPISLELAKASRFFFDRLDSFGVTEALDDSGIVDRRAFFYFSTCLLYFLAMCLLYFSNCFCYSSDAPGGSIWVEIELMILILVVDEPNDYRELVSESLRVVCDLLHEVVV